jgi:HEAT repeat protein
VPKKSVPIDPLVNEKEAARTALRKRLQYLIGLLNEPDVVVQRLAIRVLRDMGKSAAPAVAALGRLCDHPHAPVRADAAEALGVIRIGAEIVIPELLRLLGDKDIYVLLPAIQTLAKFTHLARQAEPDLKRLLEHSDEAVKAAAKVALAVIVEKD